MKDLGRFKNCYYCGKSLKAGQEASALLGGGDKLIRCNGCPLKTKVKKRVKLRKRKA